MRCRSHTDLGSLRKDGGLFPQSFWALDEANWGGEGRSVTGVQNHQWSPKPSAASGSAQVHCLVPKSIKAIRAGPEQNIDSLRKESKKELLRVGRPPSIGLKIFLPQSLLAGSTGPHLPCMVFCFLFFVSRFHMNFEFLFCFFFLLSISTKCGIETMQGTGMP